MQVATPGMNDPPRIHHGVILQYLQNSRIESILSSDKVDMNFSVVFTVRISTESRQKEPWVPKVTEDVGRSSVILPTGIWCINYIRLKTKLGQHLNPAVIEAWNIQLIFTWHWILKSKSFAYIQSQCIKKYILCSPQNPKVLAPLKNINNPRLQVVHRVNDFLSFKTSSVWSEVAPAAPPDASQHLVHVRLARPVLVRLPLQLLVLPLEEAELWARHHGGTLFLLSDDKKDTKRSGQSDLPQQPDDQSQQQQASDDAAHDHAHRDVGLLTWFTDRQRHLRRRSRFKVNN